jgi:hypothetical protein
MANTLQDPSIELKVSSPEVQFQTQCSDMRKSPYREKPELLKA